VRFNGKNNPNYRHGKQCEIQYCGCGRVKDYRSSQCSQCSGKSYPMNGNIPDWQNENIENTIKESRSLSEVARKIEVSRNTIRDFIEKNKIDISHFMAGRNRPTNLESVFCENKKMNGTVRKLILQHKLIPYICKKCGMKNEWLGEELVLELDHIDGNSKNNRIENLRFLCPNCHTQTPTNKGKNAKNRNKG
jgi:5-methylcytosine-specific restriction endonuclease McrA